MCQVKLEVKYTAKGFDKLDLKGNAEKTLKADEVEAFVKALKALDINAYKQAISTVPKVDKVEVNKLRKEVGAIKTLIDKTYASKENKPAVYTLSNTI